MGASNGSSTNVLNDAAVRHMVVRGRKEWSAFGYFVAELVTIVAWESGVELTGYSMKKRGRSWLLVLNAYTKEGKVVAFFEAPSPIDCFRCVYDKLYKSHIRWVKSKY